MSESTPHVEQFPIAKQQRMDQLLEKNSVGSISSDELPQLEELVSDAEALMATNAKVLAEFARSQSPAAPPQAVAVTVWVNPDLAEH